MGDMADLYDEFYDDYDEWSKECKYCGERGLHWEKVEGKWRLCKWREESRIVHVCKQRNHHA